MKKVYLPLVFLLALLALVSAHTLTRTVTAADGNFAPGLGGIVKTPVAAIVVTNPENNPLGAFSTGDAAVDGYIVAACARHSIDPLLIYAQMNQESAFKAKAVSPKGARGLMQLMPATAARLGVRDINDAQQNIEAGVKYMRRLLDQFGGDLNLALAGYNAGEGAVIKYGYQIPPYRETQNYVARIVARYHEMKNSPQPTSSFAASTSTVSNQTTTEKS